MLPDAAAMQTASDLVPHKEFGDAPRRSSCSTSVRSLSLTAIASALSPELEERMSVQYLTLSTAPFECDTVLEVRWALLMSAVLARDNGVAMSDLNSTAEAGRREPIRCAAGVSTALTEARW